jgi:hypothetical protein
MPWWKYQKPTEIETYRAGAGMAMVFALLNGVLWLRNTSEWRPGLMALGWLAVAMIWLWRLRLKFSLRTLLIATTLVAVLLGLIVWATRQ